MKTKNYGLTLVEILVVVGIIALLTGMLIPAVSMVQKTAKEVKQKAQFSTIELALEAFKNDYGDYPPSDMSFDGDDAGYCGAQKLTEALLGWDLLGFHPQSDWDALGTAYTDPDLNKRKGPYLDTSDVSFFMLGQIDDHDGVFLAYDNDGDPLNLDREEFINQYDLDPDRHVLCDIYSRKTIVVYNQVTGEAARYKVGTPVLYFKADTTSKYFGPPDPEIRSIYRIEDNLGLIELGSVEENTRDIRPHPLISNFRNELIDPKVSRPDRYWPYNPDSYILISAGSDGLYGTADDIRNFGN